MEFSSDELQSLFKIIHELTASEFISQSVIKLTDKERDASELFQLDKAILVFNKLTDKQVYHFAMLMLNNYDMHENHKLLHPSAFITLKELFVKVNLKDAYLRICRVLDKNSQEQTEADNAAKEVSSALNRVIQTFAENGKEMDEKARENLKALSSVLYKFLKFTKPIMHDENGNPRYKYAYVVLWDGKIREIYDICTYLNEFIAELNKRFGPTLRPIKYKL